MGYCVFMAGGRGGGGRDMEERGNVDRAWGGRLLFFSVKRKTSTMSLYSTIFILSQIAPSCKRKIEKRQANIVLKSP